MTDLNTQTLESDEIDLVELFFLLLRRLPLILFCTIAMSLVFYLRYQYFVTPQYVSSTKLYVLPKSARSEDSTLTQQDLQVGSMITKDYEQLVKTRELAQKVIAELDLRNSNGSYVSSDQMLSSISVSSTDNSRVVMISVKNPDPYMAHDITDAVSNAAAEHIQAVTNSESVNIVDRASMPTSPSLPRVKRKTLIGAMIGLMLAVLGVVIAHLADNTIKSGDDIEKYLHVSLLGSIPISKEAERGRKERIRRNRKNKKNMKQVVK